MKKLIFTAALILCLGFGTDASASIVNINDSPLSGGEPSLYQIYNTLYGQSLTSSAALMALENDFATSVGLFTSNAGSGTIRARYSGAPVSLYTYKGVDYTNTTLIGTFPASSGPLFNVYPITDTQPFGFKAHVTYSPLNIVYDWYSEIGYNNPPDGAYHFVVINTPVANTFMVGFEDMRTNGPINSDWDYQDAVFEITNLKAVTPEPATMSLLGFGLLGLIGRKLRRKFMA